MKKSLVLFFGVIFASLTILKAGAHNITFVGADGGATTNPEYTTLLKDDFWNKWKMCTQHGLRLEEQNGQVVLRGSTKLSALKARGFTGGVGLVFYDESNNVYPCEGSVYSVKTGKILLGTEDSRDLGWGVNGFSSRTVSWSFPVPSDAVYGIKVVHFHTATNRAWDDVKAFFKRAFSFLVSNGYDIATLVKKADAGTLAFEDVTQFCSNITDRAWTKGQITTEQRDAIKGIISEIVVMKNDGTVAFTPDNYDEFICFVESIQELVTNKDASSAREVIRSMEILMSCSKQGFVPKALKHIEIVLTDLNVLVGPSLKPEQEAAFAQIIKAVEVVNSLPEDAVCEHINIVVDILNDVVDLAVQAASGQKLALNDIKAKFNPVFDEIDAALVSKYGENSQEVTKFRLLRNVVYSDNVESFLNNIVDVAKEQKLIDEVQYKALKNIITELIDMKADGIIAFAPKNYADIVLFIQAIQDIASKQDIASARELTDSLQKLMISKQAYVPTALQHIENILKDVEILIGGKLKPDQKMAYDQVLNAIRIINSLPDEPVYKYSDIVLDVFNTVICLAEQQASGKAVVPADVKAKIDPLLVKIDAAFVAEYGEHSVAVEHFRAFKKIVDNLFIVIENGKNGWTSENLTTLINGFIILAQDISNKQISAEALMQFYDGVMQIANNNEGWKFEDAEAIYNIVDGLSAFVQNPKLTELKNELSKMIKK